MTRKRKGFQCMMTLSAQMAHIVYCNFNDKILLNIKIIPEAQQDSGLSCRVHLQRQQDPLRKPTRLHT